LAAGALETATPLALPQAPFTGGGGATTGVAFHESFVPLTNTIPVIALAEL
jgi:hypothetical protein